MQFTGSQLNSIRYDKTPPFYGDVNSVSSNAINFAHNSPAAIDTNNKVRLSSNWPVSKIGFKIQDLDSYGTGSSLAYIEQARALNNGKFSLAYTPSSSPFHKLSQGNSIVTAIAGRNCGLNGCTIDAAWGYTPANTEIILEHGITETKSDSVHAVGYSDFYYCLAPPKIVLQKALTGARVRTADQFSLEVTGNTVPTNNFTTTGSGSTIDNNDTATAVAVAPNTTYTIVESIVDDGNIGNYDATYSCSNATTQSATDLSSASGNTVYDSSDNTRSFTLSNLNYGDEITCTITNTPTAYTFSGIVFNDNGGISSEDKFDTSSTFTGNSSYFNGQFDSSVESGLSHPDLKVSLNDCNGTIIDATNSPNPQTVSSSGQYSFVVQPDKLPSNNKVCITEIEPDPWSDYPVDTTPNEYEFTLKSGVFNYRTGVQDNAGNTLNLDFGEVIKNQSALVLTKSQYVHQCDDTLDFTNPAINQPTSNPMVGFSDQPPQTSVEPGNCIAYRIDAYNRGHIDLKDVQITDNLQQTPIKSVFRLPYPIGSSSVIYNSNNTLPIETIVSKTFNLDKPTGTSATKATLYFNTKYGTPNSNTP